MDSFYEHGSLADILALCAAFDLLQRGWQEPATNVPTQATLLEAFLGMLGFSPVSLLSENSPRRPNWPIY